MVVFEAPLRVWFLTARPGLTRLVNEDALEESPKLTEDTRVGLYVVSAEVTNRQRAGRWDDSRLLVFILADDHESGFIYGPGGIDDLRYNTGSKGHLFGDWYWMKED